jgi:uncharacterized protein
MGCQDGSCCSSKNVSDTISLPNTFDHNTPWKMYNHLIGGIPEDIIVTDYCLGTHWTYVNSTWGMGVSYTCKGGGRRQFTMDLRGLTLREVAQLSKSWCFEEASIGIAAINAYYSQKKLLDSLGCIYDEPVELPDGSIHKMDAFELFREESTGKKITVVGHFPHVERIAEYASELTVLERDCFSDIDTPDPACEYILPSQDFAFITGTTFINKTAPRLIDLCANAKTIFVGPSVIMSPFLFSWGIDMLAGSVVNDPEMVAFNVKNGAGKFFGTALQMSALTPKN